MRAREQVRRSFGAEIQVSSTHVASGYLLPRGFHFGNWLSRTGRRGSQAATEDPHSAAANCRGDLIVIPLRTLQSRQVGC